MAAFIVVAFVVSVSCEISVAAANARTDAARSEIARARSGIERTLSVSLGAGQLNRSMALLHLRDSSAQQCSMVIAHLQRLGVRNGLRVTAIVREVATVATRRAGSESDTYEVTLDGPYRKMLSALASLAELPFVVKIRTVTFERLRSKENAGDDVRTSIQLEVFRVAKIDAARSS